MECRGGPGSGLGRVVVISYKIICAGLSLGRLGPDRIFKGLKERPLKGPLGLYRGDMRLYKVYIKGYIDVYRVLGLRVRSRDPSYCPLRSGVV